MQDKADYTFKFDQMGAELRPGYLIFVNGPCGIGKTSVGWGLLDLIYSSVLLDGDNFGAVNPFDLEDPAREPYLLRTLGLVMRHHLSAGYANLILPYVFSGPSCYEALIKEIPKDSLIVRKFRLDASQDAIKQRIRERGSVDEDWELRRFAELRELFETRWHDPEEIVVDTTNKPVPDVLFEIQKHLFEQQVL
jgi:hypothetical protein